MANSLVWDFAPCHVCTCSPEPHSEPHPAVAGAQAPHDPPSPTHTSPLLAGLEIGAYLSWFVRGLMIVTSPISYPIALLLDWLLGEEVEYFR